MECLADNQVRLHALTAGAYQSSIRKSWLQVVFSRPRTTILANDMT